MPGVGAVHRHAVREQADHGRLALGHVVAGEGDLARRLEQRGVDGDVGVAGLLLPRVLLGPVPLLAHQPAEALLVHRQALLGRHLQGQVDREAVGVVELERLRAGQHAGVLALGLLHRHVEDRGAGAEGVGERRVLRVDDPVDVGRVAAQLGELLAHRVDGGLGQLVHEPGARRRAAAALRAATAAAGCGCCGAAAGGARSCRPRCRAAPRPRSASPRCARGRRRPAARRRCAGRCRSPAR